MDTRRFDEVRERIERIEREDAERRSKLSERERQIIDMWPRYEDGEYVMIGDEVNGLGGEIVEVYITENEVAIWNNCANHMHLRPGERVKRPAPADSWEQLEEDAKKGVCEYAGAYRKRGTIDSHECDGCRFDGDGNGPTCEQRMALDIIRRAKALAGVEVGE